VGSSATGDDAFGAAAEDLGAAAGALVGDLVGEAVGAAEGASAANTVPTAKAKRATTTNRRAIIFYFLNIVIEISKRRCSKAKAVYFICLNTAEASDEGKQEDNEMDLYVLKFEKF